MGKTQSRDVQVKENDKRPAFITLKMLRTENSGMFGSYAVFSFTVRYRRFSWDVDMRYSDLIALEKKLTKEYPEFMGTIPKLPRQSRLFWQQDKQFLMTRSMVMVKYLQDILDMEEMLHKSLVLQVLGSSVISFSPELGRKGREGWLKKSSGGYREKFSRKAGDFFQVWSWRWFVLVENCIIWFKTPDDKEPQGMLQIDQEFEISMIQRVIRVTTGTRHLVLYASTQRMADTWAGDLKAFYGPTHRATRQMFDASLPARRSCDVRVYTVTRDYMHAAALAILGAQKEILITSWKMSPNTLLTRPPLPPLRLDQLLKYKADQGIQIFVLLYKEVEHIGQGNDSMKVKQKLESLSPNIHCIRHPNKFFGGSTAMLWSHHEKLLIIDRNVVFVGGVDLAFQRWDDERHMITDEDGLLFPGHDYRQPAPGKHKPVRTEKEAEEIKTIEDEEFIEVELALVDENLPQAMISTPEMEDEAYEVEVVVDFSLPENSLPVVPRTAPVAVGSASSAVTTTATATTAVTAVPEDGMGSPSATHNGSSRGSPISEAKDVPPPDEIPDNVSEVSVNYAEDRHVEMTAEEKQAAALLADRRDSEIGSSLAGRPTQRSSLYNSVKDSVAVAASNVSTTFSYFKESASSMISNYVQSQSTTKQMKSLGALESRELYPRMGWHDVQCAISGRTARDISSHFVQRWNHHRLSTANHNNEPVMHDITDDVFFTVCARCGRKDIHESEVVCPQCSYSLGPANAYSQPPSMTYLPPDPTRFSSLIFSCQFDLQVKLPFRMEGDCPVVVTMLLPGLATGDQPEVDGILLDVSGPMAEWLHAVGLRPSVGDVLLAIDGDVVTQLNSTQLRRLLVKKRRRAKLDPTLPTQLTITFRRHYLEDLHECMVKQDPMGFMPLPGHETGEGGGQDLPLVAKLGAMALSPPRPGSAPLGEGETASLYLGEGSEKSPNGSQTCVTTFGGGGNMGRDSPLRKAVPASSGYPNTPQASPLSRATPSPPPFSAPPAADDDPARRKIEEFEASRLPVSAPGQASPPREGEPSFVPLAAPNSSAPVAEAEGEGVPPPSSAVLVAPEVQALPPATQKIDAYHPACLAAAQKEVQLSISRLFHECSRSVEQVPRTIQENGSCVVQTLRSVGKWSIGTKTESSIMKCYIETIQQAQHFIYIENQFFVGNLAGEGVQNAIPFAIAERILKAHQEGTPFRVIVIIPMHPNGDFCNAMKAKVVMHYEYLTINRGVGSLFRLLRSRAPSINIGDYIGFFSLRNWGVINHKVVTEQVYIHDKLMIVDDRVVIIGSANINDRSMLGSRDSEIAVRIEDTLHLTSTFGGKPFTVGYLPFVLRNKLMRQHCADENLELSDPVNPEVYRLWTSISQKNSSIYDEIDGNMSVYRCVTIQQYKTAMENYVHRSIHDPMVQGSLSEIKGFVVDWPQNLFRNEDLGPSLATRALIPDELWV